MPESNTPIGRSSLGIGSTERLEIKLDEAPIDGGELFEVGKGHILVGLVDVLCQKPELDDRAIVLDVARVGRAATGLKRGIESRDLAHCLAQDRIQRTGLGQKAVARRLERENKIEITAGQDMRGLLPQKGFQRRWRVLVVVADVESCFCRRRNEVCRRIAYVDAGHFEI